MPCRERGRTCRHRACKSRWPDACEPSAGQKGGDMKKNAQTSPYSRSGLRQPTNTILRSLHTMVHTSMVFVLL